MTTPAANISGTVAPGYELVRTEFERNFLERGEVGAAFAAVRDGELVVDLWGGVADPAAGRLWQEDTLAVIFSGSKGLVALCMNMLIERGTINVDAAVSAYWPEFAANGKDSIRVREVLSHRARLPGVRASLEPADLVDDVAIARLLAAQAQEEDPRAIVAYHPLTYGWLCGAIIRAADGRSIGRFFTDEVAEPLDLDIWIGLPANLEAAVARLVVSDDSGADPTFDPALLSDDPVFQRIWGNPPLFVEPLLWNRPEIHAAEVPGAGAIAQARSLARMYGCLACGGSLDGVQLLSPQALRRARQEQVRERDPFLEQDLAFGLGFMLQTAQRVLGPPLDAFGHDGAGGSRHGAWPTERVGFSYLMNEMRDRDDTRGDALLAALHSCT